ncbi:MAG TPA: hypothetical protein VMG10_02980 [Gemmataceae bacterium]|nr:hypothetical protein [Gemmataceae bacterium]
MTEESERLEQLQAQLRLMEALLRRVPLLWVRCRQEGSMIIRPPGSASHDLLELVYTIEETMLPTERRA